MKRLFIFLAAVIGVLTDEPVEEFINGNRQFTADIYKEIVKSNSGNFLVSPISAETILALALEGSKGATADELIKGLKFPSTKERTASSLKSLLPQFQTSNDEIKLLSANKVYVNQNFSVNDDFKIIAKQNYLADAENIAFGEPLKAANAINSWVEDQTAGKIRGIVPPSALSDNIKAVLVNTLYFLGKWHLFERIDTRDEIFYSPSGSKEVPTMHTTETLNYYENKELKAKFLEIPYSGNEVVLTIVLPYQKVQLEQIEDKLVEALKPQPYTSERVYVALPKFSIESSVKFVPILQSLGVKKAFIGGEADLSGIGGKKGDLFISDILQKTFINVTETGTEAASSTAGLVALLSAPFQPRLTADFIANNPFIFYLKHSDTDSILFAGKYTG
ncbi:serine protease inhibitor 42Dd isoform X2 [Aethina tumida]|uniref:serine protease inhibitor 42Dd isoform X2 n=1 Tax=Aethina tumida TaxID=116153 RepID=UPI00096B014B|nr:serine protease inhibitor 42Dd isoform X2 [Aethina tumida]